MLSATIMKYERSQPTPAIDRKREIGESCTICQGESGIAFPLTHKCENFVNTDKTAGFVTFSSYDLRRIYRGLRPL